jgi:hypothetical protein
MGTDMNEPETQKPKTIELPDEDEQPTEEAEHIGPLFAFGGDDEPRGWKEIGGLRFFVGDGRRWRI